MCCIIIIVGYTELTLHKDDIYPLIDRTERLRLRLRLRLRKAGEVKGEKKCYVLRVASCGFNKNKEEERTRFYFSQRIFISFSNCLNSLSPVTSSHFFLIASAAAKQSAYDIL